MAASRPISAGAVALLLAAWGAARASGPTAVTGMHAVPVQTLREDVQRGQALAAACAALAARCDAAAVMGDERVGEPDQGGYEVRWGWLRAALHQAKDAPADRRRTLMTDAQAHLQAIVRESGSPAQDQDFTRARAEANTVLRTPEFETADGPTWWDRKKAQMMGWLARLFNGVDRLGAMAPWMGRLLEWLLFLGAAVGLVIFLLRTLARQRRRIALEQAAPMVTAWQRDATDWAERAQQHAETGAWRDAVHCLYWAAIVLLESRRAWRHNPARTPREYVRLLKPGSTQQQGLRTLTQVFERVWYGRHEAGREAWQRAQAGFHQLERGAEDPGTATPARASGATA